jgi:two-component system cell cycle response regulator
MSGRILIVDDIAANQMLLAARLSSAYYEAFTAADGAAAIRDAIAEQPDLILLDIDMPDMNGHETCRRLKTDPRSAHIPVVMLTERNTPEERIKGLDAGADDFLARPISDLELFARVRNLVRMKMMVDELRLRDETALALGIHAPRPGEADAARGPANVMLLCADPAHARARGALLEAQMNVSVRIPLDDRDALAQAERNPPDALVLERDLGKGRDGLRLISALRARPATRHVAAIMLVRPGDLEGAAAALDLGANDYLAMPCDGAELVARLASQLRRKHYSDRLRDALRDGLMMAITDPLTGLYNRRYAETHLHRMLAQCAAAGVPLGVMLLDLDRFKDVNDSYGHAAGDQVLAEFARRLQANVRGVDLVARMGGEEFLVAMPDADEAGAAIVAERVRRAVEGAPFAIGAAPGEIRITVSAGLTVAHPPDLPAARGAHDNPAQAAHDNPAQAAHDNPAQAAHDNPARGAHDSPAQVAHGAPASPSPDAGARISGARAAPGGCRHGAPAATPEPEPALGMAEGAAPRITPPLGAGPDDSARGLLERADQALYLSKRAGRNKVTTTAAA